MLNIAALLSDSPFRSLRWRAACAEHVNAHGASMVTRQGMDNLYARAYLRFLQSSEAKRIDAPADDPRLKQVGVAYLLDQDQESLQRSVVDAQILAGETDQHIAATCGVATDAISCYCAMFFDVRDRLKATGWIQLAVLEPLRVIAMQPNSTELQKRRYSLATFAYKGGPHMLNELLDIWRIGAPNRAKIESSAEDLLSRELRARTLEAVLLIEPTQKNALPLIKLAMKLAKDKEQPRKLNSRDHSRQLAAVLAILPKQ